MMNTHQLKTVFRLQDQVNTLVNPNWKTANQDWALAAGQESAEAIDHHGWKWWKDLSQACDMAQLRMEQVDIFHFMVSSFVEMGEAAGVNPVSLFLSELRENVIIFDSEAHALSDMTLIEKLKLQAGLAYANRFEPSVFTSINEDIGLTSDMLYQTYIAKYTLNTFRQDFGYKDGSYIKIWADGLEDNQHLSQVIDDLVASGQEVNETAVYAEMHKRYFEINQVALQAQVAAAGVVVDLATASNNAGV